MNDYYWNENIKLRLHEEDLIYILKLNQKIVSITEKQQLITKEDIDTYNAQRPFVSEVYDSVIEPSLLGSKNCDVINYLICNYNNINPVLTFPIFISVGDCRIKDGCYSLDTTRRKLYLYKTTLSNNIKMLGSDLKHFKIIANFLNLELAIALYGIGGYGMGMKEAGYIMGCLKEKYNYMTDIFPPSQIFTVAAGLNLRKALLSECIFYEDS